MLFIRKYALDKNIHFFITTHSNVVIDLFSKDEHAQILHVMHDGQKAIVKPVETYTECAGILNDLDVRASDLLQSNGIIWVEGPSDRAYMNKWIELWSEGKFKDGTDYQCVFYGGKLLSHLSAEDPMNENDLIKLFSINRNCIILIDSDKKSKQSPINDTKKRIEKEIKKIGGFCWITKGKEIENYIPKEALSFISTNINNNVGTYEVFSEYLEKNKKGEDKKYKANKVFFANKVVPLLKKNDLINILDVDKKMIKVIDNIKKWNKI